MSIRLETQTIVRQPLDRGALIRGIRQRKIGYTVLMSCLLGAGLIASAFGMNAKLMWLFGLLSVAYALTMLALWKLEARRRRAEPVIEVRGEALVVPSAFNIERERIVALDEIESVQLFGQGTSRYLLIGRRRGYPVRIFAFLLVRPEGLDEIAAALERGLRDRMGAATGDRLKGLQAVGEKQRSRGILSSGTLAVILCSVYALQAWNSTGSTEEVVRAFEFVRWGGISPPLIWRGQVDRLATGIVLHVNVMHLMANLLLLLWTGNALEGLIGRSRFLFLFLLSGLFGALASVLWGQSFVVVGASGSIYGVFGAYLYLRWSRSHSLPASFKLAPLWTFIALILLEFGISLWIPSVDMATHAAGLLTGFVAMFVASRGKDTLRLDEQGTMEQGATLLLGVAFVFCLAIGGARAASTGPDHDLELASDILRDARVSRPTLLHGAALRLILDDDAPRSALELARTRFSSFTLQSANESLPYETLARLHRRLDEWDESIAAQRDALERSQEPNSARRLARIELEAWKAKADTPSLGARIATAAGDLERGHLLLELDEDMDLPREIHALAVRRERPVALVQVVVRDSRAVAVDLPDDATAQLVRAKWQVTLVAPDPRPIPNGQRLWRFDK